MKRRVFLFVPALLAFGHQVFAALTRTESQQEGPYYPTEPIPIRADLLQYNSGIASGETLELSGQVTDTSGRPVANCLVEIWQCDAAGRYRHPSAPGKDDVDPHFAGFGAVNATAQGEYLFQTLMPVPYTGRPPHIHVRLKRDGQELLTTQVYLAGNTRGSGLSGAIGRLFGDRSNLIITPAGDPGKSEARFNFVVDI